MRKANHTVEQGTYPHSSGTKGNYLRRTAESGNDGRRKEKHDKTNRFNQHNSGDQGKADALLCPLIFSSTDILGNECGDRNGECGNQQKAKALCPCGRTDTRNGGAAEGIDIGLNHDIGKIDHTVLNRSRKPEPQDLFQIGGIKCQFRREHPYSTICLKQLP